MKPFLPSVFIFALVLVSVAVAEPPATPAPKLKVLFVGNSQMFYYDLPGMITLMAESAPATNARIEPGRALLGGASLKRHWDAGVAKGTALGLLAADHWDYVVIQELFSGKEPEFEEYATKFDEEIKKAGSKTILFATANVTESYAPGYHYPESFKTLNDMQIALGKKRGIPVAAAGYAWMKYLGPNPTDEARLDLYHTDKGHPGAKGSYIYACLLYAVITGNNPEGLISEFPKIRGGVSIPKEEAMKMQRAAWEQYQDSLKK